MTYQWFKNAATNIFVQPGNDNMFVSFSGTLYVSEVQPTDSTKRYFCLITLVGTDDIKLGKANTLVRSNKGILLLLLDDTSCKYACVSVVPTIFLKWHYAPLRINGM